MAIDFPSSPSEGQKFIQGSTLYRFSGGAWSASPAVARSYNYVVNPSMRIANQYGPIADIDSAAAANGGFFPVDQWQVVWGLPAGSLLQGGRRTDSTTYPNGYNIFVYSNGITPLEAASTIQMRQGIEGYRMADLQWGTPGGVPIVVRFRMTCTFPGTYAFKCTSGSLDRSYIVPIVFTGGWQWFTLAIPPCTDGSWPKNNAAGMLFGVIAGCGTTYHATPNTWVTGDKYGFAGMSVFTSGGASGFHIADVGIYADPDSTGRAPPFQVPDAKTVTMDALRYWAKQPGLRGVSVSTNNGRAGNHHTVDMAGNPAFTIVGAVTAWDQSNSTTVTSLVPYPNVHYTENTCATALTLTSRRACFNPPAADYSNYIAASARYW